MTRPFLLTCLALALLAPLAIARSAGATDGIRQKLRAQCAGHTSLSVQGDYKKKVKDDDGGRRVKKKIVVKVRAAQPFSSHKVYVDDVFIGTCRTNAIGQGTLKINEPLLRPRAGSTIRVQRAQGVFYDDRDERRERLQHYEVRARPSRNDPDIKVDYDEEFEHGVLRRRMKIDIDDADPNRAYVVKVNGFAVTDVVTDGDGDAKLEITTEYDGDDEEAPMPEWFPSLIPGDTVQVGSYEGTVSFRD